MELAILTCAAVAVGLEAFAIFGESEGAGKISR
jgi:hypothetical protein